MDQAQITATIARVLAEAETVRDDTTRTDAARQLAKDAIAQLAHARDFAAAGAPADRIEAAISSAKHLVVLAATTSKL